MRRMVLGVVMCAMMMGQTPAPPLVLVTRLPEEARVEQIVGREVVAKWEEVQIDARVVRMDPAAMKHATWEVRTADEKRRVAVLSIPWTIGSGEAAVDGQDREVHLEAAQVAELAKAGDGEFVGAWVIEGERRSNVVKVVVDGKHQLKEEPLVRMTVAEPAMAGRMPLCAVTVVRREEKDPAPTLIDLLTVRMEADGAPARNGGGVAFGGANRALAVGNAATRMMPLERYGVTADKLPKVVAAVVSQEKSTPVVVLTSTPLGDAWDAATEKLGPVAAAVEKMGGVVVGADGHAAVGYEVTARAGERKVATTTGADGRYALVGLADGEYRLICNPPGMGTPLLTVSGAVVKGEGTKVDLTFEGKQGIAGRVMGADGKGIAGETVDATWVSADGKTEMTATALTDAKGAWEMKGPFEKVSYVGVSGAGEQPEPYHEVKAGRRDLDFRRK